MKTASEIIREDLAQDIEFLHEHINEIKKDFVSYRLQDSLKIMLGKVDDLIVAELKEANGVGND